MKTNLLKMALCALATFPMGAWAQNFGEEAVVDGTDGVKTWFFTDETRYPATLTARTTLNDKLYNRSAKSTRGFTFGDTDETGYLKFSNDNVNFTVTRMGTSSSAGSYSTGYISTAGQTTKGGSDVTNQVTPFFAFNANVPGTVYVLMKGEAGVYDEGQSSWTTKYSKLRIYFVDATASPVTTVGESGTIKVDIQADGTVQELKYTATKAGSFFIGSMDNTCKIYAIRFVPKNATITIGSTGYATFGNTVGNHLLIPDGLTVYKATANKSSVTLTSVTGIRMGEGYVVKGIPDTKYTLFATATDPGDSNKGGQMVRNNADRGNFPASEVINGVTNYYYILGDDGGTAKFFQPSGSGTLAAGKAYLKTTTELSASGARGFDIIVEGEETGINNVMTNVVNDNKYYNLQGVEVAQPTKGLYIVNGKKVIIK